MPRRLRQFAVVLMVVSFALMAAHSYLLHEKPSEQQNCPLCHWLQNLTQGETPILAVEGVQIVSPASPDPPLVLCEKPHRAPFSARSPPSA
jgi:hypothetical protein